ncbi:MAG: ribosome small subunit-dependent GTPase A [bacterium]|nr:ribosome small subunit-dependent GTPase A [bacterium]
MKPSKSQQALGLTAFFLDQSKNPSLLARVAGGAHGLYRLWRPEGPESLTRLTGKLAQSGQFPQVGDFVETDGPDGPITEILTRKNQLARWTGVERKAQDGTGQLQVLAANLDLALIVAAFGEELNLRRIERYLLLCFEQKIQPVVLLNKADLAEDPQAGVAEVAALSPGLPVFAVSALLGRGLEPLELYLEPGKTWVLLGSSGVGKSTLANFLLGQASQETGGVREEDQKGRHTTTSRNLLKLPNGALLIDQPGIRELLPQSGERGLEATFSEVEALVRACGFSDCSHQNEPGCQVQAALENGTLAPERWNNFVKLQAELRHQSSRQDKASESAERQRQKKLHSGYRQILRGKQRRQQDGWD